MMSLGILSAMPQEIESVLKAMTQVKTTVLGKRTFYKGLLFNKPVVLVFSNWGKVAAATTATQLIEVFKIDNLIFTGVAGALQKHINIGDIIVGTQLYQHDMDARPLFRQFEIPIINKTAFDTDTTLSNNLFNASKAYLSQSNQEIIFRPFNICKPTVYKGAIASGDQFISSQEKITNLNKVLPDVLCVEMEGAAVAQVCYDYNLPFAIVRTISDKAQDNAHIDFQQFAQKVASTYALGILRNVLN
jgi:adenosylhomocysteine nucleosidase